LLLVAGLGPGFAIGADLPGLLDVERLASLSALWLAEPPGERAVKKSRSKFYVL
jgi:hypothetical protein